MSNAAVTKLVRDRIGGLKFWMDDNIGESIHVHLADIRLDLSKEELFNLSDELADTINKLVDVEGFDITKVDPVYFSVWLSRKLPYLKAVKIDNVKLSDLQVRWKKGLFYKYSDLPNSRVVQALQGSPKENNKDSKRSSHHVGQSSQERVDDMLESIKEHGYPYEGHYIILHGDANLIKDGQHRASCLYYLNGDMEIPVMRLYFNFPKKKKKLRKRVKEAGVKGWQIIYERAVAINNGLYIFFHKGSMKKAEKAYFKAKGIK